MISTEQKERIVSSTAQEFTFEKKDIKKKEISQNLELI